MIILFALGLLTLLWPWLAWFDYDFTQVDTDYWTVRFIFYTVYMGVMQAARVDSLDACQMLLGEGFLVSQMTAMLLFNELNFTCALFCLIPWLLVQNMNMCLDVITYTNTEKNNFVRLIGPHQAIFMMLVNTATMTFCSLVDVSGKGGSESAT